MNNHNTKHVFTDLLPAFFDLPLTILAKNTESVYLGGAAITAELAGFKKRYELEGITDFDLNCDAVSSAERFQEQDQAFLNGENFKTFDAHVYGDGELHVYLGERMNILNRHKQQEGILCLMTDIPVIAFTDIFGRLLTKDHKRFGPEVAGAGHSYMTYEKAKIAGIELTPAQAKILFYLVRGYTGAQVALFLSRSKRTIETHINILKNKLSCPSKQALIEFAIDRGFLYQLPFSLQVDQAGLIGALSD